MRGLLVTITTILMAVATSPAGAQTPAAQPHNVILFVADGLRFRMVDDSTAPTMASIAREGVSLRNSHSLFPTFTTANASAMATGHMLGDTGDFSNTIYTGFEVPGAGKSVTPFLESDPVLADVDEHFSGNYLDEATILKFARDKGYSTAAVGKIGPTLIFDHTEVGRAQTIIVDDATGSEKGVPLSTEMAERLKAANLPPVPPSRGANANYGSLLTPGTHTPNVVQQDYFANVVTRAILPLFKERAKPFVLVFWSRDPDGTAALPRRQPQFARARHQWPDIASGNSQRGRRSRPYPRGRQRTQTPRHDRYYYGCGPRLFDDFERKPNKLNHQNEVRRHATKALAPRLRRARFSGSAEGAVDRPKR